MRKSLTESLNVSAFEGTRCEVARDIRCTESDCEKFESEIKKVNSSKESKKLKLQLHDQNMDGLTNGTMDNELLPRPGPTPMNTESLLNREQGMDESPPAECISSHCDVESDAEGNDNTTSCHANSYPDIPHRVLPPRVQKKRASDNPKH